MQSICIISLQAMALQELQHPYICGYKEFFVTWDQEVAAMFVCIVMEFYKNGDLDRVLKQRRVSKQPIEELVSPVLSSYSISEGGVVSPRLIRLNIN